MKKLFFTILFLQIGINILNAQWVQQVTGATADLGGISFLNENTGYVCGSGTILKTTNGGINWINVNTINLLKPFTKIQAIDENIVYCVGMFSTIIKSSNGGLNWNVLRNGPTGTGIYGNFFALYFINPLTGWISGESQFILKTTNGGGTFDSIPTTQLVQRITDFYFLNPTTGLVCGNTGLIRKTTNGGLNWDYVSIPIGTYLPTFNNFSFINLSTGFTSTYTKQVFKTTDFGDNWDSLTYIPNTYPSIHHISFINDSKGWAVGSGYDVFHTTNGGLSWFTQGGWNGLCVLFINDSVGYKTGNTGAIYKTTNGGVTFVSNELNVVSEFKLFQNYPNPFNPVTKINFALPKQGFVTLKIYDITGREIRTLVNEVKQEGYYTVDFNGAHLSSGVYFYRIQSDDFVQTKRMVLVK